MPPRRPVTPQGHGEVLTDPPYADWQGMAIETMRAAAAWGRPVSGVPLSELRDRARKEALREAAAFSAILGLEAPLEPTLFAVTGHQPELYHPGVWVKVFLLQRFMEQTGAAGIDLVVDSDGFETVAMSTPCMRSTVQRCKDYLAVGAAGACYACAPVPDAEQIEAFCSSGADMLATLPAPALKRHFDDFCDALMQSSAKADNLAELVTFARRLYEAPAATTYLELPVTRMAKTEAFLMYVLDLACRPGELRDAYNAELAEFRTRNRTRSPLQPFPDLEVEGDTVETPFWVLRDSVRHTLWVRPGERATLIAGGEELAEVDPCAGSAEEVEEAGISLAPKAVTLTLFARVFLADLFLHGVGGARYDEVTDGIMRRMYGIEPPRFAVGSMTMYLPLGGHAVTDEEVAAAKQRANRLRQNPDQMLEEIDFESESEESRARALAAEKASLVESISAPDADKKALGARIKDVNARLADVLRPVVEAADREVASVVSLQEASEVLTDRTYPFCLWNPIEVQDKVG